MQSLLVRGTDALIHRGPDGAGFWIDQKQNIGLGHRRLSIIDLSTGRQPLTSMDGKKVAVVNGEFYDYQNTRRALQNDGYVFKTESDSEILLALYDRHGIDCLEYLRGEFAFVLWDETKQQLFAARDRFGIKPVCYAENKDGLFIASEAKALMAMGVPAAWNDYAFFHSASLQYTPQDQTLFKDIYQLKPGHVLLATKDSTNVFSYWDLDYPKESDIQDIHTEQDVISSFANLFEEAVDLRLQADVPVCFHLSGGLDSSAVLGAAAKRLKTKPQAFTVSFDHDGYDELPIAKETAAFLGADLHEVRVTQDDIIHNLSDAVYHGEGLAINGHMAAKYLLNKAIRQAGFKVALTGEGSDEVLAGYPHLRQDLFKSDAVENKQLLEDLQKSNSVSAGVQIASGAMLSTNAINHKLGFTPSFLEAKASMGCRMTSVLSDEFSTSFLDIDCYRDFINAVPVDRQLSARHPINQSLWLWSKTALANYILRTLGDGMEMSHSIEGRLPFLDHRLFEFVRGLPLRFKINGAVEKYILREAAKPYITQTVYKRQKHPFMAPPVSRFSNQKMMGYIHDCLSSVRFKHLKFFDQKKVIKLINNIDTYQDNERVAYEPVLMMILTSYLLQERFSL